MSKSKKTNRLKVYSADGLKSGLAYQRKEYDWDFNDEREFIENLLCQRFNFLLVIYSLFITASATTTQQANLTIILSLGTVLSILVSLTIWRAYIKLKINLQILHSLPQHAFEYVQNEVNALGWKALFGVNPIIGFWAPLFCCISLTLGAILSCCGVIKVSTH